MKFAINDESKTPQELRAIVLKQRAQSKKIQLQYPQYANRIFVQAEYIHVSDEIMSVPEYVQERMSERVFSETSSNNDLITIQCPLLNGEYSDLTMRGSCTFFDLYRGINDLYRVIPDHESLTVIVREFIMIKPTSFVDAEYMLTASLR